VAAADLPIGAHRRESAMSSEGNLRRKANLLGRMKTVWKGARALASGPRRIGVTRYQRLPEEHREAEELFLRHQEALLARDFATAEALLRTVTGAVARHIEVEEREILPLYREQVAAPPGGDAELIVAEHRKIEAYLKRFAEQMAAWRAQPPSPREVLALLDVQSQFKHLTDHHDRRERSFLYPALERMGLEG
jgi:hemerythrin-like domain-containing protein